MAKLSAAPEPAALGRSLRVIATDRTKAWPQGNEQNHVPCCQSPRALPPRPERTTSVNSSVLGACPHAMAGASGPPHALPPKRSSRSLQSGERGGPRGAPRAALWTNSNGTCAAKLPPSSHLKQTPVATTQAAWLSARRLRQASGLVGIIVRPHA